MNSRQGLLFIRQFSNAMSKGPSRTAGPIPPSSTSASGGINTDVPGLSDRIVKPTSGSGPVGPGASTTGEYKVPEYFSYHRMSFHEAEVELAKYRLPQPSALQK